VNGARHRGQAAWGQTSQLARVEFLRPSSDPVSRRKPTGRRELPRGRPGAAHEMCWSGVPARGGCRERGVVVRSDDPLSQATARETWRLRRLLAREPGLQQLRQVSLA